MGMDLSASTMTNKGSSASKMADSRFKTGHGKGGADALGGFQFILSAAADASSELVVGTPASLQSLDSKMKSSDSGKLDSELPNASQQDLLVNPQKTPLFSEMLMPTSVPMQLPSQVTTQAALQASSQAITQAPSQVPLGLPITTSDQVLRSVPVIDGLASSSESQTPLTPSGVESDTLTENQLAHQTLASPQQNPIKPQVVMNNQTVQPEPQTDKKLLMPIVQAQSLLPTALQPVSAAIQTQSSVLQQTVDSPVAPALQISSSVPQNVQESLATPRQSQQPIIFSSSFVQIPLQAPAQNLISGLQQFTEQSMARPFSQFAPNAIGQPKPEVMAQPGLTPLNWIPSSTVGMPEAVLSQNPIMPEVPVVPLAHQPLPAKAPILVKEVSEPSSRPGTWSEGYPAPSTVAMAQKSAGLLPPAQSGLTVAPLQTTPEWVLHRWQEPVQAVSMVQDRAEQIVNLMQVVEREIPRQEPMFLKNNGSDFSADLLHAASSVHTELQPGTTGPETPVAEAAMPTETYVAEQVSYWIGKNIQNAALQLEGLGSDPVQVQISMQGNEAYVTFNTDELQAREALENAREQLQNMLQSQGIVLSGMHIGGQGAGHGRGHERQAGQSDKKPLLTSTAEVQPQQNKPKTGQLSGSTLDLFV